jgi:phosphoglucosamine mutase
VAGSAAFVVCQYCAMPRLFGTDGIRGVANRDLTPDLALALGRAAGAVLAPDGGPIVVGRDTRLSGPMLEAALAAGLCSAGAGVRAGGILPSPAVAWLSTQEGVRAGAVVSASHNPVHDNGIKFFTSGGMKLSGDVEEDIEARLAEASVEELPVGAGVGTIGPLPDASNRYLDHLLSTLSADLDGVRVVLDCAFGAAWEVGPRAFEAAGADVVAMNAEPDGSRINVGCGSTAMDAVARRVVDEGARLGLAFDGDADRLLAVDERGGIVDGDRILGMLALALQASDDLDGNEVVATVMSNGAFRRALEERGIEVLVAPVGDRFVVEEMVERGAVLGGEQSGHIIFGRHAATGDGILTGLHVAQCVAKGDASLYELTHFYEPWPQVLVNVPVASRDALESAEKLWDEVAEVERTLGGDGRVLLRASGTEPLVRVMVEASEESVARASAQRLAEEVAEQLA